METNHASDSNLRPPHASGVMPKMGLLTMFRLGLFQLGLGLMSVLTLGVLNRVMIDELAIPATITAVTIAMYQFASPARIWFGQLSDSRPLRGYHRTGYVWLGTLLFTVLSFVALQVAWQLGASWQATQWSGATSGWIGLLAFVFVLYGLALSASSTPFAAMLVDVSEESTRSKLVGIVWSMLTVGIAIGGIMSKVLLRPLERGAEIATLQSAINGLFIIVLFVVCGLTLVATWGIEKKYSYYASRSSVANREDSITLGKALKVLTASRQTGLFFTFLLVMSISLFMQEPILEPYGGEVFNMKIGEASMLNSFWGIGTLVGLSTTGIFVVPRFGKQATTKLGCLLVALSFSLVIAAGFTQSPQVLQVVLFGFGIAAGVVTAGAINLMLDLTAAETAGTFIGAWGLAQAMSRGLAVVVGGTVLDIGRSIFPQTPVLAYGSVYALQVLGMLLAIVFLNRVNVEEFKVNAKEAIARVMQAEMDG